MTPLATGGRKTPKTMFKTRMIETITRWVLFVSLVVPWGVILAWLASGLATE